MQVHHITISSLFQKLMTIMHEVVAGKKEVLDSLGFDKRTAIDRGLGLIGVGLTSYRKHVNYYSR
jgi:hypothetical protein